MDKSEIEKYRSYLEEVEELLNSDKAKELTKEEMQEYIILVARIHARLDLLENL